MIVVLVTAVTQVTNMQLELLSYQRYHVYIGATSNLIFFVSADCLTRLKSMSKDYQNAIT